MSTKQVCSWSLSTQTSKTWANAKVCFITQHLCFLVSFRKLHTHFKNLVRQSPVSFHPKIGCPTLCLGPALKTNPTAPFSERYTQLRAAAYEVTAFVVSKMQLHENDTVPSEMSWKCVAVWVTEM